MTERKEGREEGISTKAKRKRTKEKERKKEHGKLQPPLSLSIHPILASQQPPLLSHRRKDAAHHPSHKRTTRRTRSPRADMKPLPQPLRKPRPTTPVLLGFRCRRHHHISTLISARRRSAIRPATAAAVRRPVLLLLLLLGAMPPQDLDAFFDGRVAEAVEVEEAGGASALLCLFLLCLLLLCWLLLCLLLLCLLLGGVAVGMGPVVVVGDGAGGSALGAEVEAAF